jgi:hypothetical protein
MYIYLYINICMCFLIMFMNKYIISYVEYLDDHVHLNDARGVALNPYDWTHTLCRY